jgi:hypothetical protein
MDACLKLTIGCFVLLALAAAFLGIDILYSGRGGVWMLDMLAFDLFPCDLLAFFKIYFIVTLC